MPKLTNEIIDNTVIKPSDYRLTDGSGLTIIIRKNGNKHWQFRYHVYESGKRKERIYSLGEYPSVSIEQARSEHKQLKDKLSNGIDIQTLKNKQKLTSNDKVPSFLELAREKKFKKNKKLRNRGRKVNFNIRDDLMRLQHFIITSIS